MKKIITTFLIMFLFTNIMLSQSLVKKVEKNFVIKNTIDYTIVELTKNGEKQILSIIYCDTILVEKKIKKKKKYKLYYKEKNKTKYKVLFLYK